jgi:hypothetical protein
MIDHIKLENVLVLDIETVPQYSNFTEVPENWKQLWSKKASFLARNEETPEELYQRAGIYAEFGKIICISVGIFVRNGEAYSFRTKSYYGDDEVSLLDDFATLLNSKFSGAQKLLCGHNGKEFDFPYIARRMVINGIALPKPLNIAGKKPWEINHLDTMELWKFGDFKNFTSLELLATVFDIPTPKDDIDGSMVAEVYYEDGDLERIKKYCEKDIVTLANLLLKFKKLPLLQEEDIHLA